MDMIERAIQQLGKILLDARKALGLTQAAVAKELEVTPAYISMIERGKEVPSDEILKKMAVLFGEEHVTYQDLLFRREYIQDPEKALMLAGEPLSSVSSWIDQIPYDEVRHALKTMEVRHHKGLLTDETIALLGKKILIDLEMLAQPRANVDLILEEANLLASDLAEQAESSIGLETTYN